MARFQVESGTMRLVVQAFDAHKAALWAVHCCLQQVLPVDDRPSRRAERDRDDNRLSRSPVGSVRPAGGQPSGCRVLDDYLWVRPAEDDAEENAKDRTAESDAAGSWRFSTLELVGQWNQLISALAVLDAELELGSSRQAACQLAQGA